MSRTPPNNHPPHNTEASPNPAEVSALAEEILAEGYHVGDKVFLRGGPRPHILRRLRVNGRAPVYLDNREFLILFILACHGKTLKGLPCPFPVEGDEFLSAAEILDAIDRFKASRPSVPYEVFQDAIDSEITRVISDLRKNRLQPKGINPQLIETGPRGTGYRLSAPPGNVTLDLVERPRSLKGGPVGALVAR